MKKILLSIFGILILGLINFSSAGSYTFTGSVSKSVSASSSTKPYVVNIPGFFIPYNYYSSSVGASSHFAVDCTISNLDSGGLSFILDSDGRGISIQGYYINKNTISSSSLPLRSYSNPVMYLQNGDFHFTFSAVGGGYVYGFQFYIVISNPRPAGTFSFDYSCTVSGDDFVGDTSSSSCDYSDYELKSDITENYCKNKFSSLITSFECDSLYSGYVSPAIYQNCTNSINSCSSELGLCNGNLNACLNGNYSGDIQWSSIWINNIQHLGNKNIYINIPEEIQWDYNYSDEDFNIYVEGYNVDSEYIEGIINVQNYKPSSEDFTNLVLMLAPYSKYLLFIFFVVIIWAWIKKPFKSKKL